MIESGGSFGQSSLLGLDVLDCCRDRCRVGVRRSCRNGNGRRSAPILGGDRTVCSRPDRRPHEARRLATSGNLLRSGGASTDAAGFALSDERKGFEPMRLRWPLGSEAAQPHEASSSFALFDFRIRMPTQNGVTTDIAAVETMIWRPNIGAGRRATLRRLIWLPRRPVASLGLQDRLRSEG
jgi:hypothetical protein